MHSDYKRNVKPVSQSFRRDVLRTWTVPCSVATARRGVSPALEPMYIIEDNVEG